MNFINELWRTPGVTRAAFGHGKRARNTPATRVSHSSNRPTCARILYLVSWPKADCKSRNSHSKSGSSSSTVVNANGHEELETGNGTGTVAVVAVVAVVVAAGVADTAVALAVAVVSATRVHS